jgi:hypothetical protein
MCRWAMRVFNTVTGIIRIAEAYGDTVIDATMNTKMSENELVISIHINVEYLMSILPEKKLAGV